MLMFFGDARNRLLWEMVVFRFDRFVAALKYSEPGVLRAM